jgi:hypothetical protein
MSEEMINWLKPLVIVLFIVCLAATVACSPSTAKPVAGNSPSVASSGQSNAAVSDNSATAKPVPATVAANVVDVVVAGYINHGPLQPTVTAIKDVLSKYGDRVKVTWVDSATPQGQEYFKMHGLTAHMNVIVNGTSRYEVNGKTVDFLWFEGQQWSRKDLDLVLAGLINK